MASGVIYILRHGATKLNNQTDMSEDRIRGWTDVPLAEEGRKEAQAAGIKLKAKGVDAIVASDLSRAHETAAIIGKILGVKPVTSRGLRPWNLGKFAGTSTKEALPKIADYVHNKPDEAVPEGESFNQFKERAFAGLADAVDANQGKVLVIVTHHRNERLYEAWEKAGRPEDLSIDLKEFLQKGDPPGGIKELAIVDVGQWEPKNSPDSRIAPSVNGSIGTVPRQTGKSLRGGLPSSPTANTSQPSTTTTAGGQSASPAGKNGQNMPNPSNPSMYVNMDESPGEQSAVRGTTQRATKAQAHYGIAKAGSTDRCGTCKSFRPPNDCVKVQPPIATAGWCRLGHSKVDGHAYYEEAESPAEDAAETPVMEASEQPRPAMNAEALSHGRAIAGAKALHAVGHITAAERDRHVKASQKFISKRKAFGSWAP